MLAWEGKIQMEMDQILFCLICWTGVDGFQNDPVMMIHVGNDQ